uniref:Integrase catalytic domain-containing protein n=1 Tax=Tanacetum cinerariifolium TaxID=118510 RepID=A0A699IFE7_TANCI|nr:hypothetical protein [Tanacetum cinerariifolium]
MNQFYKIKGIRREFSIARNPQQNDVAEKKNRTLIEAARTMLAYSKLPTTFWAEAVNTACYVQNRVLVIKPHNKTPYELFLGRKHALSFMRLFGCPVTILNTLDHLGKFDGKDDEGFFVGYSTHSKAFRVFNTRTKIVKDNLHITFLENKPNVTGIGPNWMFDINSLTISMNYQPVFARNQANGNAGTKANIDAGQAKKKTISEFRIQQKKMKNDQEKDEEAPRKQFEQEIKRLFGQGGLLTLTALTDLILIFTPVNAVGSTYVYLSGSIHVNADTLPNVDLLTDPLMPDLEDTADTRIFSDAYDDEVEGAEADVKNLELTTVKRTKHKGYQNCLLTCFLSQIEPKKVIQALTDPSWIEAMQDELLQFKLQKVWRLVNLPKGKHAIGTKWVYRNKKDERGIVVRNKARLMDVKSAFLYGTLKEDVYVCQPLSFEDPHFFNEFYKVENALYGLHQAHRAWKSTTGGCQVLSKRLISWQCKKQTIVANSTTKAEYVAAANYCGQVIKIHTDHNVADLLIKAFDVSGFNFLITSIGLLNL